MKMTMTMKMTCLMKRKVKAKTCFLVNKQCKIGMLLETYRKRKRRKIDRKVANKKKWLSN